MRDAGCRGKAFRSLPAASRILHPRTKTLNSSPLILLAFGFTNLAMLGWLAAAAAPLLIHLWSRHRFREAPWAAMQFLLAAMRKNARRLQLQQWLLLAVRTLIIVLTVLAVAEPYSVPLLAGGNSAPIHKVLVVDGSFSMAYRGDANTIFTRAKQLAAQLVRESRQGDVFTVVDMGQPARLIVGPDVIDHTAVATQIESLAPSCAAADLAGAVALIQKAITPDKVSKVLPTKSEIYFFTDLQRSTWNHSATEDSQSAARPGSRQAIRNPEYLLGAEIGSILAVLAQKASLTIIDLGQPQPDNLAVTNLSTTDSFVTPGRDVSFDATLHQFAQEPRKQCIVEFLVDDVPVGEQTVDVPGGGDATVRFTHRFQAAGSHAICVRAAGDHLDVDNSRWLAVPVRGEVRVLIVAGRAGGAKYLADALNPNPAGDSPIRPVIISEGDLADVKLGEFDCVFLANVAQLTSSEAERLNRYAAGGGGIVIFLGDRVVPESYNTLAAGGRGRGSAEPQAAPPGGSRALDPSHPAQPLLPARITELVTQPQFGLDPLDYRHPIVSPFRGRERAGLLTTPVARHYRLEVPKDRPSTEVAATLPGGDPFIVTAPVGNGRVVLVATDGSLSSVDTTTGEPWTNWPTWPSFLPIVRELLSYAAGNRHDHWQQFVGTPLASRGVPAPGAMNLKVKRPDGRTALISIQSTPAGAEWTYSDTSVSGIYSLEGLPEGQTQLFAVNVDTAESNLEKADAQQLPPELVVRSTWQDTTAAKTADVLTQSSWNQSLLWGVLALLFAESFMAWHFGRGTA